MLTEVWEDVVWEKEASSILENFSLILEFKRWLLQQYSWEVWIKLRSELDEEMISNDEYKNLLPFRFYDVITRHFPVEWISVMQRKMANQRNLKRDVSAWLEVSQDGASLSNHLIIIIIRKSSSQINAPGRQNTLEQFNPIWFCGLSFNQDW